MAPRLRQFTFAAADLEQACGRLELELDLGEPFHDPEVASLRLRNALYTVGDQFIEVIAATVADHGINRQLTRLGGEFCGYLLLVQVDDVGRTRARAEELGLRKLFDVDRPSIAGTQLHPAGLGGSMLEFHMPTPATAWEWAGAGWESRSADGAARVAGATLACADPRSTAERWAALLDVRPLDGDAGQRLELADTALEFVSRAADEPDHLAAIDVVAADGTTKRIDGRWWRQASSRA